MSHKEKVTHKKGNSHTQYSEGGYTTLLAFVGRARDQYSIENMNKMLGTELTCPRRKNEFWQTVSVPSLCTSLC